MPLSLRAKVQGLCFFGETKVQSESIALYKKQMRMADFLEESNGYKRERGFFSAPTSPRLLLSKWFASFKSAKPKNSKLSTGWVVHGSNSNATEIPKRTATAEHLSKTPCLDVGFGGKSQNLNLGNVASHARIAEDHVVENMGFSGCRERGRSNKKRKCVKLLKTKKQRREEVGMNALSISDEREIVSTETISGICKESRGDGTFDEYGTCSGSGLESSDQLPVSTASFSKSEELASASGKSQGEVSFSFGVGIGLAFLMYMFDLQRRMENILEDIKEERRRDVLSEHHRKQSDIVYFTPAYQGINDSGDKLYHKYHMSMGQLANASCATQLDKLPNYVRGNEMAQQMQRDQLEAELEAELEVLQLNLDTEYFSQKKNHQREETVVDDYCRLDGSNELSVEEIPREEVMSEYCGVSASELERRLHELLEKRQQERITELENALECSERRLLEKETEVSWWRENAKLFYQKRLQK
ncbi:uncharacterized protein LOC18447060 isoform X1 [Amborella trichopoda]|uniref:uncharacterized protein LOC18447060 isoform X1 n=1 Tax=Amborella trichopoda TaxID=13333 RepID=UPI0009C08FD5|nr:uncharacterized protein LOC18447060 isoform X1 [Amborella trichopoda]|eukprot:XP_020530832.1 uncharacterized protein LOC18447060 isoform X1 [Amborella trichopoda]